MPDSNTLLAGGGTGEDAVPKPRGRALQRFLTAQGWGDVTPVLLAGDASFRKYYRLSAPGRCAVLMDAPPPHEDTRPFVAVAAMLRALGLSAPEIFAEDAGNGFLLIEDFGDDTYTRLLARGADEEALYALAIDVLCELHHRVAALEPRPLPLYDVQRSLEEAELFVDWYVAAVLGAPLAAEARASYLEAWSQVLPQAMLADRTVILRDYHVDNLMLLPGRRGVRACGLLDFQDAVWGPASYDLVSLLEDARRDIAPGLRGAMAKRYLAAFPAIDRGAFERSAAILAAQRNCRILGVFTRLWRRDGKPQYLAHIPRLWRLIEGDLEHPALAPVSDWLGRHLPAAARCVPPSGRDR